MKTPAEKYKNDIHYRSLVDHMVNMIHQAQFTPSEIREAAIFACIKYEESKVRTTMVLETPSGVMTALKTLEKYNESLNRLYARIFVEEGGDSAGGE
jgi:hypothetical protein